MKTDHIGMRFIIELRQGNNQQAQYMLNQYKLLIDEILELSEFGAGLGCCVSPTEYKKQYDGQAEEVKLDNQVAEQGYIYIAKELKDKWSNFEFMLQLSIVKRHIIHH